MNYALTSSTWDEAEIEAINQVIKSRQYSMSSKVAEFEKKFAKDFGSKFEKIFYVQKVLTILKKSFVF